MEKVKKTGKKLLRILKKRWYFVVAILLVTGGFLLSAKNAQEKNKPKETYTVKRQALKETATFSGEVDADEKVKLKFQTAGRLAWVGVKEGDIVKPYQGIASLDQRELKKELQKELNTFAKTRLDLDQQQQDIRPVVIGALSKDQQERLMRTAQKVQYDVNNAVLDVELSDITLKFSYLTTPIGGVVTKVTSPYAGVNITPLDTEFDIVNPETIFFAVSADQTEVVKLSENMTGDITLDSFSDEQLSGSIRSIAYSPVEDETGTVYKIKMAMDQTASESSRLRLGMTGDATFILKEREDAIAVPTTFIQHENGKSYVLKKINNKPEKTFVKTGEEIDIATIILSGLEPGDVVYD
ncbi:hypothetical protein A3G67_02035 [Candidatus Roizmanbacteria bacterium RIFCSPLOWO2_12_FULL_40_12]|uniref:LcnD-like C-terminal domain-containing protein n=1 Tax=Candidatus Roizmanbacteria bacterium RIFCSPLOWO2_01_FULL_40_42 TaxID=1802066 RepID=A0A1F7J3N8_9BACT|nr:MAG: hypothetical protein A2779_01155 [Candidatus Roizmanbacteria bacterium RIFCSPHIGHO2_01_FULL_40_98]OGK28975.1 MAG: hypothetical protein A3C31_01795 [Candidatus Roizmanbacteria bacterium RIFCSPHIGHO2_02_FULL_40_53]OGK29559.1 MAG: hypothetical protein A2W49_03745 [Candidatus Roizmanbacteria bacterium RIFCSPHIGHO2_12_41_18]OGK37262.1 MAG: hypothetical protein A3E69_04095 [Candidatus Roizmanbacteria bacterium RIFCSPHIGHO2_12_FULL_40_130]OGK50204.1 MAG: hypothetical protein A3B50_00250 [Candi